jgi:hypothetical protein
MSDKYDVMKQWQNTAEAMRLINDRFETLTQHTFYQQAKHWFRTRKVKGAYRKYETRSIFGHYGEPYPPLDVEGPATKQVEAGVEAAI